MKYIIDIPEDVYKRTVFYREFRDINDCVITLKALEKAVPLPQGHGRLIDADEFSKRLVNASMFYRGETADMFDTRFADGLREADIKLSEAPTVVEADKGNKE